ncbi:MAG: glutamate--tRNA ligase, partial [Anaerolineales bacterium]
ITPLIQTRMTTLDEGPGLAGFFFKETIEVTRESLIIKNLDTEASAAALHKSLEILEVLPEFTAANMEPPMRAVAEELGLKVGALFNVLRNAVTSQEVSPPLFESMEIIGREEVLERLNQAIALLNAAQSS